MSMHTTITKEYNKKSLFLMLLKSYHDLHPLFKAKSSLAYKIDEYKSLNNFRMVVGTSKPINELVNIHLEKLIYKTKRFV